MALAPVQAAAATLDDTTTEFVPGSPLPPLWQWFFFLPRVPQSRLGLDGHPQRGGFMPPIELPRRMFAGARMRFLKPLLIGRPARRQSVIRDVSEKEGRAGKLAFVTVGAPHPPGRRSLRRRGAGHRLSRTRRACRRPRALRARAGPGRFVDADDHPRPDTAAFASQLSRSTLIASTMTEPMPRPRKGIRAWWFMAHSRPYC